MSFSTVSSKIFGRFTINPRSTEKNRSISTDVQGAKQNISIYCGSSIPSHRPSAEIFRKPEFFSINSETLDTSAVSVLCYLFAV